MDWSVGQFGDARLDNGGAAILEQMVMRKTVCLKRLGGARDGEERIGRFFGNDSVTADKIIDSWGERTGAAAAGRHVLAIQACPCEGGGHDKGEVQDHGGQPPGARPGRQRQYIRSARPCDDRGRCRHTGSFGPRGRRCVEPPGHRRDLASQTEPGRPGIEPPAFAGTSLAGKPGYTLFAAAAGFPLAGTATIEIPARLPDRAKRTATVEMRFGEVEICRPRGERDRTPRLRRDKPAQIRAVAAGRYTRDRPSGGSGSHSLAVVNHTRGRGCGGGLADRRLVSDAMGHRAIIPSDEIARSESGGQPAHHRETPDKAGGDHRESGLSGHTAGAGTGWQTWAAGLNCVP